MKLSIRLGRWALAAAIALCGWSVQAATEPAPAKAPPVKPLDAKKCYSCHDNVEELHSGGRHATVN